MLMSQNGRVVLPTYGGPLVARTIPGTAAKYLGGLLDGDVDLIGRYIGHRWHTEIEPLDPASCWGYNYRPIRGASGGFSNHASGTAGDLNASLHPLGARTLGPVKLLKLSRMQTDLRQAVRFGAFYSGRPDEMHWEIVGTDADVARVAARIRAGALPNVPDELRDRLEQAPPAPAPAPVPAPSPAPTTNEDDMPYSEAQLEAIIARAIDAQKDAIAAQVLTRPWLRDPGNGGSVVTLEQVCRAVLSLLESVPGRTAAETLEASWLRNPDDPGSVVSVQSALRSILDGVEQIPKG